MLILCHVKNQKVELRHDEENLQKRASVVLPRPGDNSAHVIPMANAPNRPNLLKIEDNNTKQKW